MWPVRRADNLTTFMWRFSWNPWAPYSWIPQGLYRDCFCFSLLIFMTIHNLSEKIRGQPKVFSRIKYGLRAAILTCIPKGNKTEHRIQSYRADNVIVSATSRLLLSQDTKLHKASTVAFTSLTVSAVTYRHSWTIKGNLVSSVIIRNALSPKPLKQIKYRNKSVILMIKMVNFLVIMFHVPCTPNYCWRFTKRCNVPRIQKFLSVPSHQTLL